MGVEGRKEIFQKHFFLFLGDSVTTKAVNVCRFYCHKHDVVTLEAPIKA